MVNTGNGTVEDNGRCLIIEFKSDASGFTTGGSPEEGWTNQLESESAKQFASIAGDEEFMVIRFKPTPPDPNAPTPTYTVAVGRKSSASGNIVVRKFTTTGARDSKQVIAHTDSAPTVTSTAIEEADTVVALEFNPRGDRLIAAYLDATDSKYKVVAFTVDPNGNLIGETATPFNVDAWVTGATMGQHSISWLSDDKVIMAANHATNGRIRSFRIDPGNNSIVPIGSDAVALGGTDLDRVSVVSYHPNPDQKVFAVGQDGDGGGTNAFIKLFSYVNDAITLLSGGSQSLDLSADTTFNDLKWQLPEGRAISFATVAGGTKTHAYTLSANTIDGSSVANLAKESADLKCIAWDSTGNNFARHDVFNSDVNAYTVSSRYTGTFDKIHMVLGRDLTLNDEYVIADDTIWDCNGSTITMGLGSKITINSGKTLTIKNGTLKGVRGRPGSHIIENLVFSSATSTLRLEHSTVRPVTPVQMGVGRIVPVGDDSFVDTRFGAIKYANAGQSFVPEVETGDTSVLGDFQMDTKAHFDVSLGKMIETMSGSTLPSGAVFDTGAAPAPISLPLIDEAGDSDATTDEAFDKTVNYLAWSHDGTQVLTIHTGDLESADNAMTDFSDKDPGILRFDQYDSSAGTLTNKYDCRSSGAAMDATVTADSASLDTRGVKGSIIAAEFRPVLENTAGQTEYLVALIRNAPPTGTPDIQMLRYIPTAATEAARLLPLKTRVGESAVTQTLTAAANIVAAKWSNSGELLAVITSEPKLRMYEYKPSAKALIETSASGVVCATPDVNHQLEWDRNQDKLYYMGSGTYQVFEVGTKGTSITRSVNDTVTFTGKTGLRLSHHPSDKLIAVSHNVANASTVTLYSHDAVGKITNSSSVPTQQGNVKTLSTGNGYAIDADVVTDLKWDMSGQGLFLITNDSTNYKISGFEYKSGDLGSFDFGQGGANLASTTVKPTLMSWGQGVIAVGGEGSSTNNDRACVQVMAKKAAISKTDSTTVLSTDHTSIVADFSVDSGTWEIAGSTSDGGEPTKVLELMGHTELTIKDTATLYLKNLILKGVFAAEPTDRTTGVVDLCKTIKINGGGKLKLENVILEVWGDVRFDRADSSGTATIEFAGSNPIKVFSPGGFGVFAIGDSNAGNTVSATAAGTGNMAVSFGSGTKLESSIVKAATSLIPAENISAPTRASARFAVGKIQEGAEFFGAFARQMEDAMASGGKMAVTFEREDSDSGIPKQQFAGGATAATAESMFVESDAEVVVSGEGLFTFSGHTNIVMGETSSDPELTRIRAEQGTEITLEENAVVTISGTGSLDLTEASLKMKPNSKLKLGSSSTDNVRLVGRNSDITLEDGAVIAFGSGTTSAVLDRTTVNVADNASIQVNADTDGTSLADATCATWKWIDSTFTGGTSVALVVHPNLGTAQTAVTYNSCRTSNMLIRTKASSTACGTPSTVRDVTNVSGAADTIISLLATDSTASGSFLAQRGGTLVHDNATGHVGIMGADLKVHWQHLSDTETDTYPILAVNGDLSCLTGALNPVVRPAPANETQVFL